MALLAQNLNFHLCFVPFVRLMKSLKLTLLIFSELADKIFAILKKIVRELGQRGLQALLEFWDILKQFLLCLHCRTKWIVVVLDSKSPSKLFLKQQEFKSAIQDEPTTAYRFHAMYL